MSPTIDFTTVMGDISQGYDDFVASTIPLMAKLELTPPDPSLIPEMTSFAQSASSAAQDAVNEFNKLSQDNKDAINAAQSALANSQAAQKDVAAKQEALRAALAALPPNPTPQQQQDIIDKTTLLNAAIVVLNAAGDALGTVIEAVGGAVAGVVTAVGNVVEAGLGVVEKVLGWIGRIFGG